MSAIANTRAAERAVDEVIMMLPGKNIKCFAELRFLQSEYMAAPNFLPRGDEEQLSG